MTVGTFGRVDEHENWEAEAEKQEVIGQRQAVVGEAARVIEKEWGGLDRNEQLTAEPSNHGQRKKQTCEEVWRSGAADGSLAPAE